MSENCEDYDLPARHWVTAYCKKCKEKAWQFVLEEYWDSKFMESDWIVYSIHTSYADIVKLSRSNSIIISIKGHEKSNYY